MAELARSIDPNLKPERIDTYNSWQAEQKIPVVRGFFVEDINKLPLEPWELKGVPCSFVVLDGTGGTNDAYVCEIPAGGKTKPQKHMYEEMVYVTQGYGATTVWQRDTKKKHTFEWGPGSMFAIPINSDYQHFNASGSEAARYFAVTNCCFMMNLFHNVDYIFNSDYVFMDRFDPHTEGYFSGDGELTGRFFMTTNFVPDTHTLKLTDYSERGKGSTNMKFNLAKNTMGAHISEFPVGTYKKGHRHGPGAHVIILSGQGYSVLWPQGEKPQRVDWRPGSVVVPPDQWFHQHFNSGAHPARYLALRWNNWRYRFMKSQDGEGGTFTSVKLGGGQIEFEDEDPQIHRDFEAAMKKAGARCNMPYHPGCTQAQ
jgi:quercetin dioxygenase-like cupin family protein